MQDITLRGSYFFDPVFSKRQVLYHGFSFLIRCYGRYQRTGGILQVTAARFIDLMIRRINILCGIYLEHGTRKICRFIVEIIIKSRQYFAIFMDDKLAFCRMVFIFHFNDGILTNSIYLVCGIGIHFNLCVDRI